jgi:8-oxo-dGTP diphosphatase
MRTNRPSAAFTARNWVGEPVNAEPHKCSEVAWHDFGDLPDDTVTYIRAGLNACDRDQGATLALDGWPR